MTTLWYNIMQIFPSSIYFPSLLYDGGWVSVKSGCLVLPLTTCIKRNIIPVILIWWGTLAASLYWISVILCSVNPEDLRLHIKCDKWHFRFARILFCSHHLWLTVLSLWIFLTRQIWRWIIRSWGEAVPQTPCSQSCFYFQLLITFGFTPFETT